MRGIEQCEENASSRGFPGLAIRVWPVGIDRLRIQASGIAPAGEEGRRLCVESQTWCCSHSRNWAM